MHGERPGVKSIRRRKERGEAADLPRLREKQNGLDPPRVRGWRKQSELERGSRILSTADCELGGLCGCLADRGRAVQSLVLIVCGIYVGHIGGVVQQRGAMSSGVAEICPVC